MRTVPWSKVFDGARLLGTTPMANVPLTEGTHTLTFVNPELPPQKRSVTVGAGEEVRLSLELEMSGSLIVEERGAVALLTLSNPQKRNALDPPMLEALVRGDRALAAERRARRRC